MVRRYQEGDAARIAEIFRRSIHQLASRHYSERQLLAWAGRREGVAAWSQRCQQKRPFVNEIGGQVVGFMELDPDGHIDCSYVDPDFAGRGVMDEILREVRREALRQGLKRLHAEVSLAGRGFFERNGFSVLRDNEVDIGGVVLRNFLMEADLTG